MNCGKKKATLHSTHFFVVIFLPLTNLVEVDVLFMFALLGVAELNELFMVLNDVKPPWPVLKKSSIKLPPIDRPNGLNSDVVLNAFWG